MNDKIVRRNLNFDTTTRKVNSKYRVKYQDSSAFNTLKVICTYGNVEQTFITEARNLPKDSDSIYFQAEREGCSFKVKWCGKAQDIPWTIEGQSSRRLVSPKTDKPVNKPTELFQSSEAKKRIIQSSFISANELDEIVPNAPGPVATYTPDKKEYKGRATSDESYVIDLCDEVLKMKASRQHKFDFLVGDTGYRLPVDAYYESLNLVIEYHERQHTEAVAFFDNKPTVSGVSRGEQRKIYDQRRAEILPKHGIKLVIISYRDFGTSKKLQRNRNNDILVVKNLLKI